ncbi:MAG: S41 family peptidase, partial [Algoriella sp.]
QDYRKGDGYISTGDKYMYAGGYLRFLNNQIGLVDSVDITFTKNNTVFTQTMKREFSKKKDKKSIKSVKNDSIPEKKVEKVAKIKLSKEDKKRKKELEKHKSDIKKYFVYNKSKNDYQRELIFPNKEDSTTVILNIKSFSISHGKEAYPFVFDSIQKLNVKNLILDIRNNGGGYAKDINYLYSFLTSREGKQTVMADEMKINSRFSLVKNYFNQFGIVGNTITLPYSLYTYTKTLLKTHKAEDGYFYRSTNKKDYIEQPNKYKGNLYVLTNGSSYSATSVISSALQNEGKAIFVGEETGGDYNGTVAGSMKIYELKNSKLKLLYGLIDFKPNTSRELIGRGVMPNIPISMTFDDILNKKDPQLDWILNDIKSKK